MNNRNSVRSGAPALSELVDRARTGWEWAWPAIAPYGPGTLIDDIAESCANRGLTTIDAFRADAADILRDVTGLAELTQFTHRDAVAKLHHARSLILAIDLVDFQHRNVRVRAKDRAWVPLITGPILVDRGNMEWRLWWPHEGALARCTLGHLLTTGGDRRFNVGKAAATYLLSELGCAGSEASELTAPDLLRGAQQRRLSITGTGGRKSRGLPVDGCQADLLQLTASYLTHSRLGRSDGGGAPIYQERAGTRGSFEVGVNKSLGRLVEWVAIIPVGLATDSLARAAACDELIAGNIRHALDLLGRESRLNRIMNVPNTYPHEAGL